MVNQYFHEKIDKNSKKEGIKTAEEEKEVNTKNYIILIEN